MTFTSEVQEKVNDSFNLPDTKSKSRYTNTKKVGLFVFSFGLAIGGFSSASKSHSNTPKQKIEIVDCQQNSSSKTIDQSCAEEFGNNGGDLEEVEMLLGISGYVGTIVLLTLAHDAYKDNRSILNGEYLFKKEY